MSCPPVPVELDGERIGGNQAALVALPWCERITVTLSPDWNERGRGVVDVEAAEAIQVDLLPIDLTKHSPTPELKGQILLAILRPVPKLVRFPRKDKELKWEDGTLVVQLYHNYEVGHSTLPIDFPGAELTEVVRLLETGELAWLSHNGVAVPTLRSELGLSPSLSAEPHWAQGIIALADSLCPDLAVSRDALLGLPLRLYSVAGLALYRALHALGEDLRSNRREVFSRFLQGPTVTLRDLLEDEHIQVTGLWSQMPILGTDNSWRSIQDIRDAIGSGPIDIIGLPLQGHDTNFLSWCAATLAQVGLKVSAEFKLRASDRVPVRVIAEEGDPAPVTEGHKLFPPLMFLPFRGSGHLRSSRVRVINADHPFAVWLLDRAPEIAARYPGLFERIRSDLRLNWYWDLDVSSALQRLNAALERLRKLHPSVRPSKKLVLTQEDIFDLRR